MFGKGKGRISPVFSYAPWYEVNGESGGAAPHITLCIQVLRYPNLFKKILIVGS
jgi:hypothetical protein